MPISEYDSFIGPVRINLPAGQGTVKIAAITKTNKEYFLTRVAKDGKSMIVLTGENRNEMIRFPLAKILNAFEEYSGKTDSIPVEQAVFSVENKQAKMTVLVNEISIDRSGKTEFSNLELRLFVEIK